MQLVAFITNPLAIIMTTEARWIKSLSSTVILLGIAHKGYVNLKRAKKESK